MNLDQLYIVIQILVYLVGAVWVIAEIKSNGKATTVELTGLRSEIKDVKIAVRKHVDDIHSIDKRVIKLEYGGGPKANGT